MGRFAGWMSSRQWTDEVWHRWMRLIWRPPCKAVSQVSAVTENIYRKLLHRKSRYLFVYCTLLVMVTQPKPPSQKAYGKGVTVVHGMRMFCCRWVLFLKCQLSVTSADPHLILNAGLKRSARPSIHFNALLILRASWKSIFSIVNKAIGVAATVTENFTMHETKCIISANKKNDGSVLRAFCLCLKWRFPGREVRYAKWILQPWHCFC